MLCNKEFFLSDMEHQDYDIDYLINGLSNICRWNGQTVIFYSVLDHLLYCIDIFNYVFESKMDEKFGKKLEVISLERLDKEAPTHYIEGMVDVMTHDLQEAYCGDMISSLKCQEGMEKYREIENQIMKGIRNKFGITHEYKEDLISNVDKMALIGEAKLLLPYNMYAHIKETYSELEEPPIPPTIRDSMESRIVYKKCFYNFIGDYHYEKQKG